MNIFQYQGQEEDHYTNILMSILSLHNCDLTRPFLNELIPGESQAFSFRDTAGYLRKKQCPRDHKEYEYLIGVAPYQNGLKPNELEINLNSIPDAWICGENFNLLFEFKIRGTLDENQLQAHKKLLGANAKVIRLQWDDVIDALSKVSNRGNELYNFLIGDFIEVCKNFKDKRNSSGMPKEVISNAKNEQTDYFIITGSREVGYYTVDVVRDGDTIRLNDELKGIMAARRWIAQYVMDHHPSIAISYNGVETIVSDYCVVPGRPAKNNQWNQWRIGTMMK
ncbi:hypothetical protein [Paenibacillus harenae]|uniref:hypothetical protein n=1 Tax=Paenibacillus harenae TaxID=306543 RepID=UPI002794AD21|nr:hypothetical protein [Paenibacillus harenae]MDQ0059445.1 hypothetical protein [Paenibacillus harenae]